MPFSLFLCLSLVLGTPPLDALLEKVDALLAAHVRADGRVDYRKLHNHPVALDALALEIASFDLTPLTVQERKAFWINAYNVLVLRAIAQRYPVASPLDVPGFFDTLRHRVAGEQMTLDQIEKQKLLAVTPDARLHFALVCAARGCPPLLTRAYRPAHLSQQLDAQVRAAANAVAQVRVDAKKKEVQLSELFRWYQGDFEREGKTLLRWINRYRTDPIPASYRIVFMPYDWRLNEAR